MKQHETPEARAAERDRAIEALRRAKFTARAINRILGGARVDSAAPRPKPVERLDAKIEAIAMRLINTLSNSNWVVHLDELQGERTTRAIAAPRGAAMFLARRILGDGASFPAIGSYFNRDHSTVIHACTVRAWADIDDDRLMKAVHRVLRGYGKRYP